MQKKNYLPNLQSVLQDSILSVVPIQALYILEIPMNNSNNNNRSAFFLDIDNLCGAPMATEAQVREVVLAFEKQFSIGPSDLIFCAATAKAAAFVKFFRPAFHVQVGRGKDGSDLRLLELADPQWLKSRFGRVVIGSGDGIFQPLAMELANLNVKVEITCGHGAMSRSFREVAHCCTLAGGFNISHLNFAVAA